LVARRTALRQADSLKGHGYTVGKSIIGRDLKQIMEIDQRKIGRDPSTDEVYQKLEKLLNEECKKLENHVVTFELTGSEPLISKPIAEKPAVSEAVEEKEEIKVVKTPEKIVEKEPVKSVIKKVTPPTPTFEPTSEYDLPEEKPKPTETEKSATKGTMEPVLQAKIGFVLAGILDHYDDIWVSKKNDGSYSVEMMDGPICLFKVSEGEKISFSPDSFKGISTNIKLEIQKKFVSLSKLIL
jgi:hypothetical protein